MWYSFLLKGCFMFLNLSLSLPQISIYNIRTCMPLANLYNISFDWCRTYTYIHTYTYYISLYINFQGIIVMADIMYPSNPDKLHWCLNITLIYYYNFGPHKCSCTWGVNYNYAYKFNCFIHCYKFSTWTRRYYAFMRWFLAKMKSLFFLRMQDYHIKL